MTDPMYRISDHCKKGAVVKYILPDPAYILRDPAYRISDQKRESILENNKDNNY